MGSEFFFETGSQITGVSRLRPEGIGSEGTRLCALERLPDADKGSRKRLRGNGATLRQRSVPEIERLPSRELRLRWSGAQRAQRSGEGWPERRRLGAMMSCPARRPGRHGSSGGSRCEPVGGGWRSRGRSTAERGASAQRGRRAKTHPVTAPCPLSLLAQQLPRFLSSRSACAKLRAAEDSDSGIGALLRRRLAQFISWDQTAGGDLRRFTEQTTTRTTIK